MNLLAVSVNQPRALYMLSPHSTGGTHPSSPIPGTLVSPVRIKCEWVLGCLGSCLIQNCKPFLFPCFRSWQNRLREKERTLQVDVEPDYSSKSWCKSMESTGKSGLPSDGRGFTRWFASWLIPFPGFQKEINNYRTKISDLCDLITG